MIHNNKKMKPNPKSQCVCLRNFADLCRLHGKHGKPPTFLFRCDEGIFQDKPHHQQRNPWNGKGDDRIYRLQSGEERRPRGSCKRCKPFYVKIRVAELGSLLSGAKMAMKIVVKRVFTIFASNASFLRVITNLQN